jgi:RNA polymerase sigma-70 factor, ECF subfamily
MSPLRTQSLRFLTGALVAAETVVRRGVRATAESLPSEPRVPTVLTEADSEQVARLREGERAALGEIYDAHHAALRAFAVRLLGDPATAEDLVHDVFVALPVALQRFRGDCSVRTFVMSIAVNQARRHVRNAQRRRQALERYSELPAPSPDCPEHEISVRREVEALRAALLALPVAQSAAFVLCEAEHLPAAEAARIMGVPEATIRTRVWHARRKLREALAEEMP